MLNREKGPEQSMMKAQVRLNFLTEDKVVEGSRIYYKPVVSGDVKMVGECIGAENLNIVGTNGVYNCDQKILGKSIEVRVNPRLWEEINKLAWEYQTVTKTRQVFLDGKMQTEEYVEKGKALLLEVAIDEIVYAKLTTQRDGDTLGFTVYAYSILDFAGESIGRLTTQKLSLEEIDDLLTKDVAVAAERRQEAVNRRRSAGVTTRAGLEGREENTEASEKAQEANPFG